MSASRFLLVAGSKYETRKSTARNHVNIIYHALRLKVMDDPHHNFTLAPVLDLEIDLERFTFFTSSL